jgi:transcriptional regulator with XRE-family HTH domain
MIRNSRQASVARKKYQDLMIAARDSKAENRFSFLSLAEDIASELREYEAIRAGKVNTFTVLGVDQIGDSLVKARLAKGWTQQQLAESLGVSEQMVQKDEAHSYEHAGLTRLAEIADTLGYEREGSMRPSRQYSEHSRQDITTYISYTHNSAVTVTTAPLASLWGTAPSIMTVPAFLGIRTDPVGVGQWKISPLDTHQWCAPQLSFGSYPGLYFSGAWATICFPQGGAVGKSSASGGSSSIVAVQRSGAVS